MEEGTGQSNSLLDKIKQFYFKVEDKYYQLLDSLQEKGLPVYPYFVDPIETRGLPSMPFAFLIPLLILVGLFLVFGLLAPTGGLSVTVSAQTGPVVGANVSLFVDGNVFGTAVTSATGIATFSGVPLGKPASVKVEADGYSSKFQSVSLDKATSSVSILLDSGIGVKLNDFIVTVLDSNNAPIRGATVRFQTLATGSGDSVQTREDGTATLQLEDLNQIIMLNVEANGYTSDQRAVRGSDGTVSFKLTSTGLLPPGDGGDQPIRGTVVARVVDEQGNTIPAVVSLFIQGSSTQLASDLVESGVARFAEVAPVGTIVYAVAQPSSDEFLRATSDPQTIAPNEDLTIVLNAKKATSGSTQQIAFTVKSSGKAIPSTRLMLYSVDTNTFLASAVSDAAGLASVTLSSTLQLGNFYAVANTDGYLPMNMVVNARTMALELTPTAPGNNVNFDVEVETADGLPASSADVEILDASGHFLMFQRQTGPSGTITFNGAPVNTLLRANAFLDAATGSSDLFQVSLPESGEKTISVALSRPVGTIHVSAIDLISGQQVNSALLTAYVDSTSGQVASTCTTDATGTCELRNAWANRHLILVGEATGYESATSNQYTIAPGEAKNVQLYFTPTTFKNQTFVSFVSLTDDKGNELVALPAVEKAAYYNAKFVATFANGSNRQQIYVRIGDESNIAQEDSIISSFTYSPSAIGAPVASHATTFNPAGECANDLLNADVDNNGKKWVQVEYAGVSGSVELNVRVLVKPTATNTQKLTLNYRAVSINSGKYSRYPQDNQLGLDRKNNAKDECYAETVQKQFSILDGNVVCNPEGTACLVVGFSQPGDNNYAPSPFTATLNQPFDIHYEVRSFGAIEGQSAYVKLVSKDSLVNFADYRGDGTPTFQQANTADVNAPNSIAQILLGDSKTVYNGVVSATGLVPSDYAQFNVEFGDARGAAVVNPRAFVVVQGTGALQISDVVPVEFEIGKSKDLKFTLRSSTGVAITDATISFEEQSGEPFAGDVPVQIVGDNTPGQGEDGKYIIKRIRPTAPGIFLLRAARDRYAGTSVELTAKVGEFFETDAGDYLALTCNTTNVRVKNKLDVEVSADIYIDPSCADLSGQGIVRVDAGTDGQAGTAHYRIASFKPDRTRILSLKPNSRESCQVQITSKDPRTGTTNLDAPIQLENTCNTVNTVTYSDADGVVYINGNVFQPPRLLIDVFSQMRYGSYQPTNFWDPRYADAVSYNAPPVGGAQSYYARMGVVDPATGRPLQQYVDPTSPYANQAGQVGNGQFGQYGSADPYGGGSAFDIRRINSKRNYSIAWVNQDAEPHAFTCKNRAGDTVVDVAELAPGAVYVANITKTGLYYCKLENANKGTIKIKSMCPQKGAVYYTRLLTRCMARKAIGDSGIFDGGKQHAATIAASIKTQLVVSPTGIAVTQDPSKPTKVECTKVQGGAECKLHITPLVQANGFAFSIRDQTGEPSYEGTIVDSNARTCFTIDDPSRASTYRTLLDPLVSGISTVGLTSKPQYSSWIIKFNELGNCVKVRPTAAGQDFEARIWDEQGSKFITGPAFLQFKVCSTKQINNCYNIKLLVDPITAGEASHIDGRLLFSLVPNQGSLFYRTNTAGDPKEPGFVLNNLPTERILLGQSSTTGEATRVVEPNTIGILTGNEPSQPGKFNAISDFKNGFYLCTEKGGCAATGSQAQIVKRYTPSPADVKGNDDISQVSNVLGDVIGNYKSEAIPTDTIDKALYCSGSNYCSSASEALAVDSASNYIEAALREQYQYVETINLDSSLDNTQDALSGCFQEVFAEIAAQEAQYQMCKTLADFCSGKQYLDPEEEEVEEGESFAAGLSLDSVLGDSQTIVKDVICEETEAGQNLQALRDCLQPGNRACRDMIANRIAGNLKQEKIRSVVKEVPVVDFKDPKISLVTKRIQDNPALAQANIANGVTAGGYNVYSFSFDPQKIIGTAANSGEKLFEVRPPGYDFSKYIARFAEASSALVVGTASLPFNSIYNWATANPGATPDASLLAIVQGFPYVTVHGTGTSASSEVKFDKFQPTLLTLNKYPIMRAVDNQARETKTDTNEADKSGIGCTVQGRPVDPLRLFDSCEDYRSSANQDTFDKKASVDKNPLVKSLVFMAVPSNLAAKINPTSPVWPDDVDFSVVASPQVELRNDGAVTRGESRPLVAGVANVPIVGPVLGQMLYPYTKTDLKPLTIPKADIKRYAIQVTNCRYTRNPTTNAIEMLDDSNNCLPAQWPINQLFPGSRGDVLNAGVPFKAGEKRTCSARSTCVALKLDGNHLSVATVAGLRLAPETSNDAFESSAPSEKLVDGTPLAEVARDLVRYYVDESSRAGVLTKVLKDSKNACSLYGDEDSALLVCDETSEDLSSPLNLQLKPDELFTNVPLTASAGALPLKINSVQITDKQKQPVTIDQTSEFVSIAAISRSKGITRYKGVKVKEILEQPPAPIDLPTLTGFNAQLGSTPTIVAVVKYQNEATGTPVSKVIIYRAQGNSVVALAQIDKDASDNIILTPFDILQPIDEVYTSRYADQPGFELKNGGDTQIYGKFFSIEQAVHKLVANHPVNLGPEKNLLRATFRTTIDGQKDVANIAIDFKSTKNTFDFVIGDKFAKSLRDYDTSLANVGGDQMLLVKKAALETALTGTEISVLCDSTQTANGKFAFAVYTDLYKKDGENYAAPETLSVSDKTVPFELSNCIAQFKAVDITGFEQAYEAQVTAEPVGDAKKFTFDFTNAVTTTMSVGACGISSPSFASLTSAGNFEYSLATSNNALHSLLVSSASQQVSVLLDKSTRVGIYRQSTDGSRQSIHLVGQDDKNKKLCEQDLALTRIKDCASVGLIVTSDANAGTVKFAKISSGTSMPSDVDPSSIESVSYDTALSQVFALNDVAGDAVAPLPGTTLTPSKVYALGPLSNGVRSIICASALTGPVASATRYSSCGLAPDVKKLKVTEDGNFIMPLTVSLPGVDSISMKTRLVTVTTDISGNYAEIIAPYYLSLAPAEFTGSFNGVKSCEQALTLPAVPFCRDVNLDLTFNAANKLLTVADTDDFSLLSVSSVVYEKPDGTLGVVTDRDSSTSDSARKYFTPSTPWNWAYLLTGGSGNRRVLCRQRFN